MLNLLSFFFPNNWLSLYVFAAVIPLDDKLFLFMPLLPYLDDPFEIYPLVEY